jgi:hypothetical protein
MTRARDTADTQDNLGGAVAPFVAGKNGVINGGFDIWQRGTSFASAAGNALYTADRWSFLNPGSATFTISRQSTSDTTNLANIQYCLRLQRNSGQTGTTVNYLTQSIESVNSIPYAGKTITFSFYARAGANYSATSSILGVNVSSGTGTDQNINSSFTGIATVISQNATLTTTWQRFTFTGTVASTATQLGFYFNWSPVGTASTNDYFEVTGVQMEQGSVATPFARAGGSIGGELALCQRYYERLTAAMVYEHFGVGQGNSGTSTQVLGTVYFKVPKRAAVSSVVDFSTLGVYDTVAIQAISAVSMSFAGINSATVLCTTSGTTALRFYQIMANNSTSAYIGFSAEL